MEYVNDGLTRLEVVLEAKKFTVTETGDIQYRPLDPDIHLKLSSTSFRVQPQQTYYVFYEASWPKSPQWFVIYAVSGFNFRTAQGMNVRLELPHTVYLLPKTGVERPDIIVDRAELDPAANKVTLEVENRGIISGGCSRRSWSTTKKSRKRQGFRYSPTASACWKFP